MALFRFFQLEVIALHIGFFRQSLNSLTKSIIYIDIVCSHMLCALHLFYIFAQNFNDANGSGYFFFFLYFRSFSCRISCHGICDNAKSTDAGREIVMLETNYYPQNAVPIPIYTPALCTGCYHTQRRSCCCRCTIFRMSRSFPIKKTISILHELKTQSAGRDLSRFTR